MSLKNRILCVNVQIPKKLLGEVMFYLKYGALAPTYPFHQNPPTNGQTVDTEDGWICFSHMELGDEDHTNACYTAEGDLASWQCSENFIALALVGTKIRFSPKMPDQKVLDKIGTLLQKTFDICVRNANLYNIKYPIASMFWFSPCSMWQLRAERIKEFAQNIGIELEEAAPETDSITSPI